MDPAIAVAIDGQAAAGKTVVGRELARRLGVPFLDTGIMYRAITWLALRHCIPMEDEEGLTELAREASLQLNDWEGRSILLDNVEINLELRAVEVDRHVSLVARVSGVRRELVRQQREIAAGSGGIVMVGRDIGAVVLPDASLKVFMVASPEVRARRRYSELTDQGQPSDYSQALANVTGRDEIDSQRADAPLARNPDAFLIDSSDLTVEQVVDKLLELLDAGTGKSAP